MKDLATFLTYSGVSTLLFLIPLLIRNWKKRKANKILAGILFSFSLLFFTYASSYFDWNAIAMIVAPTGIIISFALGALIFQYIKTIYTSTIEFKSFAKSLLPFIIAFVVYSIPQYILGPSMQGKGIVFKIISFGIPFLGIMHFAYYLFLSHRLLKRYRRLIKNNYANLNALDLKWLSIWILGFIGFLLIDILSGFLIVLYPSYTFFAYLNLFYLVLLIWYIGYYGAHQMHVFLIYEGASEFDGNRSEQTEIVKTIPFFNCESEEFDQLKIRLNELFTKEEFFKKQDLSLKETADILEITDKKLSHLLNVCLNANFYDYVNSFRVAHFQNRVEEGAAEKLTLLAIAFDSGFNSKATFNRVFKQKMGITPIQFKKSLLKRSQSSH